MTTTSTLPRIRVVTYGVGGPDNAPPTPTRATPTRAGAASAPSASGEAAVPAVPGERRPVVDVALDSDPIARRAFDNATAFDRHLATAFGRNGYDGKGGTLELVVHSPERNNAFWLTNERRIELGDGDGQLFSPLGDSAEIVAHEMVHGLIHAERRLDYSKPSQAALHESFADVLATAMTPGTWKVGTGVFTPGIDGDAFRDLSAPTVGHASKLDAAKGEAHLMSGVPSLAAVKVAERIGRDRMQQVWYHALVDDLQRGSGFAGAARATMTAAARLYGAGSGEVQAVQDAWKAVGVDAGWTRARRERFDRAAADAAAGARAAG